MDKQQITSLLNNFNSNDVEVLVKDASNGAFIDIDGTEIYNSTLEGINRFHLLVGGNGGGAEPANSISIPDIPNSF